MREEAQGSCAHVSLFTASTRRAQRGRAATGLPGAFGDGACSAPCTPLGARWPWRRFPLRQACYAPHVRLPFLNPKGIASFGPAIVLIVNAVHAAFNSSVRAPAVSEGSALMQ